MDRRFVRGVRSIVWNGKEYRYQALPSVRLLEDFYSIAVDGLSMRSNTYLPGASTWPGIRTGALNWSSILLLDSSAIAGVVTKILSASELLRNIAFNLLFMLPTNWPRP